MTKGNSKKGTAKPKAAIRKTTEVQTNFSKVNFTKTIKGNFHEITVGTPCKIYVDSTMSAMYITANPTTSVSKKAQTR
jgi:hypothetical protein